MYALRVTRVWSCKGAHRSLPLCCSVCMLEVSPPLEAQKSETDSLAWHPSCLSCVLQIYWPASCGERQKAAKPLRPVDQVSGGQFFRSLRPSRAHTESRARGARR